MMETDAGSQLTKVHCVYHVSLELPWLSFV